MQWAGEIDHPHKVAINIAHVRALLEQALTQDPTILADPVKVCPCFKISGFSKLGQREYCDVTAFQ